jgi:acetyl-CoA synthetase
MKELQPIYPVSEQAKAHTHITSTQYEQLYRQSIEQPEAFWAEQAQKFIDWITPWQQVKHVDFNKPNIQWFAGGKLNVSVNCIDRHLLSKADKTAIIYEADEPDQHQHITYQELHDKVCQLANLLKQRGVKKGDRVCIYMPMIPEVGYAMLACARIGAVHSVVFGGFSTESIKARILDADCQVVITADEAVRGGKIIPLKANVDAALADCPNVHSVIVVTRTGNDIAWYPERDVDYAEALNLPTQCEPEVMDAEDPLFILYTSGSTGAPKGVVHTCGGYLLYVAMTHKYVFDYQDGEVFWCTADAGWITGHSYVFYGPLANGATTVVFEGVPTYPTASRFWQVCDKHQVNIFYTAPTAIRALMSLGDEWVTDASNRHSIRLLGTVGEPINPEAWHWYYEVVGESRCSIVDTWWQTETGGILITSLPGAVPMKPGAAGKPFFGVKPAIVNEAGEVLTGEAKGRLVLTDSWPGQMRTVYGDHQRFHDTYFLQYPGYYFTGDGAKRDADGFYWITGRIDDVLNVSGHRLGTAEIESALVLHPSVAEAAVVGYPHEIKGQGIYCYVTLMSKAHLTDELVDELREFVAHELGRFAKPDYIQFAPALPKTRSGKIMRRILRKIAENEIDYLGDTSTLADPSVVDNLIKHRIIHPKS